MELDLFYRFFCRDCACGTLRFERETGTDLLTTLPSAEKRRISRRQFISTYKSSRLVICGPICRSRSTTTRPWTCVECNALTIPSAWWTKRLYYSGLRQTHLMTLTTARCALRNVLATPRCFYFNLIRIIKTNKGTRCASWMLMVFVMKLCCTISKYHSRGLIFFRCFYMKGNNCIIGDAGRLGRRLYVWPSRYVVCHSRRRMRSQWRRCFRWLV
jgi:hypothetical protein